MNRSVTVEARPNPRLRRFPRKPRPVRLPARPQARPMAVEKEKKRKMFSSITEPAAAAVITVSDSCACGEREDLSGPAVAQLLEELGFRVTAREVAPDEA